MEKRLIAALSVGLGVALLVIAFLVGRMTGRSTVPTVQTPIVIERETPREVPAVAAQQAAPVQPQPIPEPVPLHEARSQAPIQKTPAESQSTPRAPTSAIAAYFAKIDAIQVAGSGDPTAFAQGILGGIQSGDTSGIDSLVNGAKRALAQATAVQPPPACAEYHRRLLESLSDAANGTDKIRGAIAKGDFSGVATLAQQMQATQQKVDDLERMKKQLLGQ